MQDYLNYYCVCMLRSFSDGDSDDDRGGGNHGDHDGDRDGDHGDGDHGDRDGGGEVGDVSNHLAQFSVPTTYRYTHPAHVRAAHSAVQDDPLYSALSQLEDLAGML